MKKKLSLLTVLIILLIVTTIFLLAAVVSAERKEGFQKAKTKGSFVYYEGSAIVSGAYHVQIEDDGIGSEAGLVCFSVHGSTERLIPREQDSRSPWFCFTNTAKARSALKIPKNTPPDTCIIYGKATVQISKYIADRCESECHDEAILDRVISYEKPTFRKECNVMP